MPKRDPLLAIVGRPNVGKSTLFNRLVGARQAVVADLPGVTRDRLYARVTKYSIPFVAVDTGGIDLEASDELTQKAVLQAKAAIAEADAVICLFDARQGLHEDDRQVVSILRQASFPVLYLANKIDGVEQETLRHEFFALGLGQVEDVSALHGRRIRECLEELLTKLPDYQALLQREKDRAEKEQIAEDIARNRAEALEGEESDGSEDLEEDEEESELILPEEPQFAPVYVPGESEGSAEDYRRDHGLIRKRPRIVDPDLVEPEEPEVDEVSKPLDLIRVAIVGRPNVGKSTLLNRLLGEEKAITSDIAGTTRDALGYEVTREGQKFLFVDTAGLRKKSRVDDEIERFCTLRSLGALTEADVAVVLLDATAGISEQDSKIVGLAHEHGVGIVLAVNKWDALEKDHQTVKKFEVQVREDFKFARYAPIVFISALNGRRCPKVIELVRQVAYQRVRRVATSRVNRTILRAFRFKAPPPARGKGVKFYYASQVGIEPPTFVAFFNVAKGIHFSYQRYLKNALRKEFGFEGTELRIRFRKR